LKISSDQLKFKIESDIIENNKLRQIELNQLFTKKVPVFERPEIQSLLIEDPLEYSITTNNLVLYFYFINNKNSLSIMFLLIIGISIFLTLQKNRFLHLGYKKDQLKNFNILKNPIASSILVVLGLYQFILPMPPLMFSILIWTISTIALTKIMQNTIKPFVWRIWIAIFILNLIALFDLIILIHFVGESFLILTINFLGIAIGCYTYLNRHQTERKIYFWSIMIATLLQLLSLYFLVNGHYNLGKFLMTKAVYTIIVVFTLYNAFILVKEFRMVFKIIKENETDNDNELNEIPKNHSFYFYLLLFVSWFLLMTRNTYTVQNFIEPFRNSISETRNIGSISFTIENIFIFILIILFSIFISKVVSFLASDTQIIKSKNKSFGSRLFLFRITIVTVGVLIAFASAGIPLDRITLIISALGVGIGFGMQNLVNNLISGLIIAFEKPVSLDDIIEVGTQSGKMKSIGIRSSVVTTFDGADVVIPNGELLNKNLINWTLGSSSRRSEIRFGVAYRTDLEFTKKVLFEILENNKNVLKTPEPVIWFTNFGDSSIDLVLKYWIRHFDIDYETKSELIIAIDKVLKENNIVIPFSQQDIHIIKKDLEPISKTKQNNTPDHL
jgi:potassium efflux system protein